MEAQIRTLSLPQGTAEGIEAALGKARFLLIKAPRGYLVCGYFKEETIEALGDAACIVRGVGSFEEMLERQVSWVSPAAAKLGVAEAMTGREALGRFF